MLCGSSAKGRRIAFGIGVPELAVADHGHASGPRQIDYRRFVDPDTTAAATLVEAGQHWESETVDMTIACVAGLLQRGRRIRTGFRSCNCSATRR